MEKTGILEKVAGFVLKCAAESPDEAYRNATHAVVILENNKITAEERMILWNVGNMLLEEMRKHKYL